MPNLRATTRSRSPLGPLAFAAAAILVCSERPARAQGEFELRLLRPSLTVSGYGVARSDFSDVDADYSASTGSLFAVIPIGGVRLSEGKVTAWQPMLWLGAAATSQSFNVLDRDPRLYSGVLNGSLLWATSKPNLHYVSLGTSFAEDDETIHDDLRLRLSALYIGSYQKSPSFSFLYGGFYTFIYGRGLLLPLFGISWKPSDTWSLYGIVPLSWTLSQKLSDHFRLNYMLWVAGQQFGFKNDGIFPVADDKVYERVREQHLGVELDWHPTPGFSVLTQAGVAVARRMAFGPVDSNTDTFLDEKIDPAPYVKLSFRIPLGKSLIDEVGGRAVEAP